MKLEFLRFTPSLSLRLSRTLALGVCSAGVVVLAAWVSRSPTYQSSVMSSHVAMNANSAAGLVMASVSLWLLAGPARPRWSKRIALGLAIAVAALGAATAIEYLLGTNLGIDGLLGLNPRVEINTSNPGRMAPESAVNFVLLGAALYWTTRPRLVVAAQASAVVVAMMGLFNLIGYSYGAVGFYKLDHLSSIGVVAASAFVALAAGLLCARPESGLMGSMISQLPGGVLIRRLLLAVFALPLLLGGLELQGEQAGLFNHAIGTGLAEVTGSVALMILIWRTARVLERNARERIRLEGILHQANERLEQKVSERTVLLQSANTMLTHEISERVHMEALLRLQSSALESAANAISISDPTGKIEWVNPAFCALTGYSAAEAIGRNPNELLGSGRHNEAFFEGLWTTILAGRVWKSEVVNRRKDGSLFTEFQTITPVKDVNGQISHFIAIKEDITEKKQLEEQALRTQRIQNLGMLAAGIAHDFNNALTPILMAGPVLREKVSDAEGMRMLDMIEQSSERGAALVRQMLSFARGTSKKREQVNVRSVLGEMLEFARATFPKSISIESDLARATWPVWGDPTEIHQVFLNLCINARDAMADGGRLTVTASDCALDDAAAAGIADARAGSFLAVEVRDTGTGIAPDVLARIWAPFFTTKAPGKGTGLGLSTVRGIIRQHGGFAAVQTVSGESALHGTAFTVYLPAAVEPCTVAAKAGSSCCEGARVGAGELILVVDDEDSVRDVGARILLRNGYRVMTACDGSEAFAKYSSRPDEFRLLLTDSDMPRMGGGELIRALHQLNPGLPVVIMSGMDDQRDESAKTHATEYLAKPFSAENLLSKVRSALDEARPALPCLAEA